jgi:hypothetical protein
MLLRELTAVYCENHMKHINTLYGQNTKLLMWQQIVHIVNTVFQRLGIEKKQEIDMCRWTVGRFVTVVMNLQIP